MRLLNSATCLRAQRRLVGRTAFVFDAGAGSPPVGEPVFNVSFQHFVWHSSLSNSNFLDTEVVRKCKNVRREMRIRRLSALLSFPSFDLVSIYLPFPLIPLFSSLPRSVPAMMLCRRPHGVFRRRRAQNHV